MKRRESPTEKNKKNTSADAVRATFVRLFGKYDLKNEQQLVFFGKWLLFIVLLALEVMLILRQIDHFDDKGGWASLTRLLILIGTLTTSQALKLFVIKQNKNRIVFYVLDAVITCGFVFFATGSFPMIIYLFVLTQFYLIFESTRSSVILFIVSTLIYACFDVVQGALMAQGAIQWFALVRETFGSMLVLLVHFVVVQVAWAFYRQFIKLDQTLKKLDESNRELEKAYQTVAEMTALKERQRIAKEIHDTAGHSITTVIMQTEAAKLIIDGNPNEAKTKIVAANLQAKHALEELRNSVHLLSGSMENQSLKTSILAILRESMDGTGIVIRSNVQDVSVLPSKQRFLCNALKEGISNALRHGKATAFWFELKEEDGKVYFLLSDNGVGVDANEIKVGFGLSSMQEGAKSLGGEMSIHSEEGEGLELRLTLPADKVETGEV